MLKIAISNNPAFDYSLYEIEQKGISYSVNTVKEFKKKYDRIELIIGYDNLITFDKWYMPDKIIELCQLVVMKRNTQSMEQSNHKYYNAAYIVETPTIEISASDIRNRIQRNLPIDNLVPEKVKEYISNNHLYKKAK